MRHGICVEVKVNARPLPRDAHATRRALFERLHLSCIRAHVQARRDQEACARCERLERYGARPSRSAGSCRDERRDARGKAQDGVSERCSRRWRCGCRGGSWTVGQRRQNERQAALFAFALKACPVRFLGALRCCAEFCDRDEGLKSRHVCARKSLKCGKRRF
jgi:hypothetical protein